MIERLANDVLQDEYFITLNNKAAKLLANNLFLENGRSIKLTEKELSDTLRFADILSNSKNPKARNKAFQLITLLNEDYKANPYYQTFSHSVLAKLGNFPGIEFLRNENNSSELPFDRELEKKVKEFVQAVPDTEDLIFTDSQFELYTKISTSKHFSFSGPTSMGKSFIIKSFIRKVVGNKPENIVIMVPTRALINQFSIDLNKELKDILEHYNYTVVTNSSVSELPAAEQHYIFVLTPERLLSYLSQKNNPPIAYLFVDEAHKLAAEKDTRAVTSYSAISKSLRKNPNLNLYFSSPNVSNPEVFLRLFKKDEKLFFKTIEAPVSQNLFFVDLVDKKVTHYLDDEAHLFEPKIVTDAVTIYDILSAIGADESNIVYCSSRFDAVDKAAKLFAKGQNQEIEVSKKVKKVISQIKAYIHRDYYLSEFLGKGIGYHFGNLPQIIRNKVEGLFKEREIKFVFCTSTLLEGVNLPAKNVFILNNKVYGNSFFKPIDFWNLAGRAGRLKHELSGNIICLKETDKDWKKHESLLNSDTEIKLNPTVENYIDKKLKKIEQVLNENPDIKFDSGIMKEILEYIANIISIDTLEIQRANYSSEIIKKLIADNKESIIELAKKKNGEVEVPSSVLNSNNSIKLKIQNEVYIALKKQARNPSIIKLPNKVTYEVCKEWLHKFYTLFHWATEEKKFKSENQLDYFAVLMNQWINGIALSQIINESIVYHIRTRGTLMVGYKNGKPSYEVFNNSKHHINVLIGNIIDDIESVLRFLFEKYFNNYYAMLVEILGEENAGVNWAAFLEYGTQNSIVIALQNYGLSRHSANYIFSRHRDCLDVEGDKLIGVNIEKLKRNINKEDVEFEEISSILF